MAWGLVLVAGAVVSAVVGTVVLYGGITWIADRGTTALVALVGTRGLELLVGAPMLLIAGWGFISMIRGTSARKMTPRQMLLGAVSVVLIGALGAGLVISAIAGGGGTESSAF